MQDEFQELKKGEIKQILIIKCNEVLPEFSFLAHKKNSYIFQRIKNFGKLKIYENLHVAHSLKDKVITCSVASVINSEYTFSNQYSNGVLNSNKDLKALKSNLSTLPFQDAFYFHNGTTKDVIKITQEIFLDFKVYGLPFLESQFENINSNLLIKKGLDFILELQINKESIKKEITDELQRSRFIISSLKHPVYIEIKNSLQSESSESKESRQQIPKMVLEFLELYWNDNLVSL